MAAHSEHCSAAVTEAMWAAQSADSWSESRAGKSVCRKVERLGSTWADWMVGLTELTMVATMAQNSVAPRAALWVLNSVASMEKQMVVKWELSTVAHSAENWEGSTAECLAHSKVGGWACLMAERMVCPKVALWDASMVDSSAARWERSKVVHLVEQMAVLSGHCLVA